MNNTVVRDNPRTLIMNSSQGYSVGGSGFAEASDLDGSYGAGGIYSTVGDFAKWMDNFNNGKLGGMEVVERLVALDTLNNGDTMTYAKGIVVDEYRGLKSY